MGARLSDSPESVMRGVAKYARVSVSPENDIRDEDSRPRVSDSPESATLCVVKHARVSVSPESVMRGTDVVLGVSVSPESDMQRAMERTKLLGRI